MAIRSRDTKTVLNELQAGADANQKDASGAGNGGVAEEFIRALLKNGTDPNIKDISEATALMDAMARPEIVSILRAKGAR